MFDREQLQIYQRINRAQSTLKAQIRGRRPSLSAESRRLKPNQMEDERLCKIEHANRRLLNNISSILTREKTRTVCTHRPRSRASSASSQRSLNSSQRKFEKQRIDRENSKMLCRLQEKKSCLDVTNMLKFSEQHARYRSTVSSSDMIPCAFYNKFSASKPLLPKRVPRKRPDQQFFESSLISAQETAYLPTNSRIEESGSS